MSGSSTGGIGAAVQEAVQDPVESQRIVTMDEFTRIREGMTYAMERKQRLVPIREAFGGLDGPVAALRDASPQARHHFTQADQVNQLVSASEADPDLGFMARMMALCSLPRTNPGMARPRLDEQERRARTVGVRVTAAEAAEAAGAEPDRGAMLSNAIK